MQMLKGIALSFVTVLIGLGLIATSVDNFSADSVGSSIACIVLGLIMLFAGGMFFYAFVLIPAKKEKSALKKDLAGLVLEDQTGAEDADDTDRLLSGFRAGMRRFFAERGTPENDPLQFTATQLYWHSLRLQKRRMGSLGVTLDFESVRKSYGGVSVSKRSFFDGKYRITEAGERISSTRVYSIGGRPALTRKDDEIARSTILTAERAGDSDEIVCPNCGNPASRENLLDGCDFCGTKFTVEDLGARVSTFALRRDYEVAYAKYTDSRKHYGTRAFLVGAVPVALISIISAFMFLGDVDAGPVMRFVAGSFTVLVCAGLAGFLTTWIFWTAIFPALQLKASGIRWTKKKIEERRRAASRTGEVEQRIRAFDPLFSSEGFFGNVRNKLATLVFADRPEEARVFAPGLPGGFTEAHRTVADMDVTDFELLDFRYGTESQSIIAGVTLNLVCAGSSGFSQREEAFTLTLEKSAACRTEAVCAPSVLTCRSCGAPLTLLNGGRCEYCGNSLDLRAVDWVITSVTPVRTA